MGFEAARLQDIAKDVGVQPSLPRYPTKEALYDAVIRDALGRLQRDLVGRAIGSLSLKRRWLDLRGPTQIYRKVNLSAILLRSNFTR